MVDALLNVMYQLLTLLILGIYKSRYSFGQHSCVKLHIVKI